MAIFTLLLLTGVFNPGKGGLALRFGSIPFVLLAATAAVVSWRGSRTTLLGDRIVVRRFLRTRTFNRSEVSNVVLGSGASFSGRRFQSLMLVLRNGERVSLGLGSRPGSKAAPTCVTDEAMQGIKSWLAE